MINSDITYAEALSLIRKRNGLTQKQLADKIGCSQGHISHIECGLCQPNIDLAWRIVVALDSDFRNLLREY